MTKLNRIFLIGHFVGMILLDLQKAFDTVDQYLINRT